MKYRKALEYDRFRDNIEKRVRSEYLAHPRAYVTDFYRRKAAASYNGTAISIAIAVFLNIIWQVYSSILLRQAAHSQLPSSEIPNIQVVILLTGLCTLVLSILAIRFVRQLCIASKHRMLIEEEELSRLRRRRF